MQHTFKNIKFIYIHVKTIHILYTVTGRDIILLRVYSGIKLLSNIVYAI
jgi:hypothetical protein